MIHGDKTKPEPPHLEVVLLLTATSRLLYPLPIPLTEGSAVPGVEGGTLVVSKRGTD